MTNSFKKLALFGFCAALLCLNSACLAPKPMAAAGLFGGWKSAAEGGESQPGYGAQVVAGGSDGQNAVLGLVGVTRLNFTGGYDRILNFGAQYRRALSVVPGAGAPFVGAEATFMKETSVLDWPGGNPSATGYSLGGLVGYGLPVGTFKVNLFSGVSYFHIGDFTVDGVAAWSGSNHILLRGGLEFQLK